MKSAIVLATVVTSAAAFTAPQSVRRSSTRLAAIDPFASAADLPQHVDALSQFFSSLTVADLDVDAAASAASDAASAAAPVADAAAQQGNGWFGFLAAPIEGLLKLIHVGLTGMGMSADSWGISIIAMTVVIKALTFPLTKSQLEGTNKMQALQPEVKALQAKYQSNPEVMNQKISEVYQTNEVNPLAGCVPSLVQIPVFIGLYRAVLGLAKDDKLNEPFLFLPNLEGPTYGADPAHGSDWILKGWVDGVPSLGWEDTVAFLIIPVFLVISQFASMQLMQPKTENGEAPPGNAVLKVLPLMIGWFSLNVPAALGVYWVVNNLVTTASTLYVRANMPAPSVVGGAGGSAGAGPSVMDARTTDFNPTPLNERAAGFGGSAADGGDGMTTLTPVDAEIVAADADADGPPAPDARDQVPAAPQAKVPARRSRGGRRLSPRSRRARPPPPVSRPHALRASPHSAAARGQEEEEEEEEELRQLASARGRYDRGSRGCARRAGGGGRPRGGLSRTGVRAEMGRRRGTQRDGARRHRNAARRDIATPRGKGVSSGDGTISARAPRGRGEECPQLSQ